MSKYPIRNSPRGIRTTPPQSWKGATMPRDGESAEDFLARFNRAIETDWTELDQEERRVLVAHWSRHGQHDAVDVVADLARQAGFATVRRRSVDAAGFYLQLCFAV